MKGRVLTVDAASSKATLTLKRTMLRDKREPVSCYDDVSDGDGRTFTVVLLYYCGELSRIRRRVSYLFVLLRARVEVSADAALSLAGKVVMAENPFAPDDFTCSGISFVRTRERTLQWKR